MVSHWLRDPELVDSARGVDLGLANYQIVGCAGEVRGVTSAENERLVTYLDSLYVADPDAFKSTAAAPYLREPVAAHMNKLLGRTVVQDCRADLWEMHF
jgi:hypothetical protein